MAVLEQRCALRQRVRGDIRSKTGPRMRSCNSRSEMIRHCPLPSCFCMRYIRIGAYGRWQQSAGCPERWWKEQVGAQAMLSRSTGTLTEAQRNTRLTLKPPSSSCRRRPLLEAGFKPGRIFCPAPVRAVPSAGVQGRPAPPFQHRSVESVLLPDQ